MSPKTAVVAWNGRVAPVFDLAPEYYLFQESSENAGNALCPQIFQGAGWASKVEELVKNNVEQVICGALCRRCAQTMENHGIRVVSGIAGDVAELHQQGLEKIESLEEYQMPGMNIQNRGKRFGCGRSAGRGEGIGVGRGACRGEGAGIGRGAELQYQQSEVIRNNGGTGRGKGLRNGQGRGLRNRLRDGSCQNPGSGRGRL